MKSKFKRFFDAIVLSHASRVIAFVIHKYSSSCRIVEVISKNLYNNKLVKNQRAIYVSWHQRMFYLSYYLAHQNLTIMISQSRDGEYANAVARHLGFGSVRGSSHRASTKAAREMIHQLRNGSCSAGILVDGPTGPAMKVKAGAVMLARATGLPLIPVMYGAKDALHLNSWDRHLIPKPWTDIVICVGDAMTVPSNASRDVCNHMRSMLQEQLDQMTHWCDHYWKGM